MLLLNGTIHTHKKRFTRVLRGIARFAEAREKNGVWKNNNGIKNPKLSQYCVSIVSGGHRMPSFGRAKHRKLKMRGNKRNFPGRRHNWLAGNQNKRTTHILLQVPLVDSFSCIFLLSRMWRKNRVWEISIPTPQPHTHTAFWVPLFYQLLGHLGGMSCSILSAVFSLKEFSILTTCYQNMVGEEGRLKAGNSLKCLYNLHTGFQRRV